MGGRGQSSMVGGLFVADDDDGSDVDATRFTPWTRETYPGIWLPYPEWDNVRKAINRIFDDEAKAVPGFRGRVRHGNFWYYFRVLEYDDYIIYDKGLIHGRPSSRRA